VPEDLTPSPDVREVRTVVAAINRGALVILGSGAVAYLFLAMVWLGIGLRRGGSERRLLRITLAPDLGLGMLGVAATVLIALVATAWTTAVSSDRDAAHSRGRRQVQYALVFATGIGGVVVALAVAVHLLGPASNILGCLGCVGLAAVFAWIAADVAVLMRGDRAVYDGLTDLNSQLRSDRLAAAVGYWHDRSRRIDWEPPRRQRLRGFGEVLSILLIGASGQAAVLLIAGGWPAVTGYVGWYFTGLLVATLAGRRSVRSMVSAFVVGPLSSLVLPALVIASAILIAVVALVAPVDRVALTTGVPAVLWLVLSLATLFGPFLVAGLSVRAGWLAKRLPSTRARVIERIERAADLRKDPEPDRLWSWGQRLVEAGRRVRGSSLLAEPTEVEVFSD